MGSKRAFAAESTNDGPWHETDVQWLPGSSPLTDAFRTLAMGHIGALIAALLVAWMVAAARRP